jgi:hypothetical protein
VEIDPRPDEQHFGEASLVFLEHPTLSEHWRRRAGIEEFANRKLICAVAPDAPAGGFGG